MSASIKLIKSSQYRNDAKNPYFSPIALCTVAASRLAVRLVMGNATFGVNPDATAVGVDLSAEVEKYGLLIEL